MEAKIITLACKGCTYADIARQLGLTLSKAYAVGRFYGLRKRAEISTQQRQKIGRLVATDLSLREIANRVGCSKDSVRRERMKHAPQTPNSARAKRCPQCGAKINTYTCVACSVRGSK